MAKKKDIELTPEQEEEFSNGREDGEGDE